MALIKCKECGRDVSSQADTCPHCGFAISKSKEFTSLIPTNVDLNQFTWSSRRMLTIILLVSIICILGIILLFFHTNKSQQLLKHYLLAQGKDKYDFICKSPTITQKDIDLYYQGTEYVTKVVSIKNLQSTPDGILYSYNVIGSQGSQGGATLWVLHRPDGNWCVDWMSSNRYIGSLDDAYNGRLDNLTVFLHLTSSDYYNYAYANEKDFYYSYQVEDSDVNLTVYLPKDDKGAETIYQALKDTHGKTILYVKAKLTYSAISHKYGSPQLVKSGDKSVATIFEPEIIRY